MTTNVEPVPSLVRPRRRWWRSLLVGIAILFCGMLIGSGLTMRVLWNRVTDIVQHPDQLPQRITQRVNRFLDLTPEQQTKVQDILAKRQLSIEALRRQVYPNIQSEMDGLRDDVAAILNPDQARRWKERFEQLRTRWWPPLLPQPAPQTAAPAGPAQ